MIFKILLTICLSASLTVLSSAYVAWDGPRDLPIFPKTPKVYDIDLDQSYEDQWKPILLDFDTALLSFIQQLGIHADLAFELLDVVDYPLVASYNTEFAEEVQAISRIMNVTFTEVVMLNVVYDLTAQCTSTLIQDPEGNVFHSRNLDFPWAPSLADMIFHGRYFKDGELLYEAISLVGYTGLLTGIKTGAYSFSIDQFNLPKDPDVIQNIEIAVMDIVELLRQGQTPPFVVRDAFRTIPDYDSFVKYLEDTGTTSRAFYIVAGTQPGQGVVITKYRDSVENTTVLDAENGKWFVVQTNYAGNVPDPEDDNRATAGTDFLNGIGWSHITKENLVEEVMTQYPLFNNETIHTTVMQASTGYFNTTIWSWSE